MTKSRKRIAYIAGGVLLLFLLYRYYQSRATAAQQAASTATNPNQSASDYAALAGQEQSDVSALQQAEQQDVGGLQSAIIGSAAQDQQALAQAQAQEQQDIAGVGGQIAGLAGQISGLTPQMAGAAPPAPPANKKFGGHTGKVQGPGGGFIQLAGGKWVGANGRIFNSKPFGQKPSSSPHVTAHQPAQRGRGSAGQSVASRSHNPKPNIPPPRAAPPPPQSQSQTFQSEAPQLHAGERFSGLFAFLGAGGVGKIGKGGGYRPIAGTNLVVGSGDVIKTRREAGV